MRLRPIEVFGLKFDTFKELLELCGYTSLMSVNQALNRYGSIEAFVKRRLKVQNDAEAAQQLKHLQEAARAKLCRAVDPAVDKLVSIAIERLLFSADADTTIKAVKGLYNDARPESELKQILMQRSRDLQQSQ